jgi:hypothetical protein
VNESNTGARVVTWMIIGSVALLASWVSGFPWNYLQQ